MKERAGLFGGTFNPIHRGHLRAAEEIMSRFMLDRVLFIPSYIPPHKGAAEIAPAAARLEMVELACKRHPGFIASSIEVEARTTSYSIITLQRVREVYPEALFFFILGVDAFLEIGTWREHERVLAECLFIIISRPGYSFKAVRNVMDGALTPLMKKIPDGEQVDAALLSGARIFLCPIRGLEISSTAVRDRLRRGESVSGLLPDEVESYIRDNKLYSGRKES